MSLINEGMLSSDTDEWETPQDTFDTLNEVYGFTIDVCATKYNAKCRRYFDKEVDGLHQEWKDEVCFMNPPYGNNISFWVRKAYEESMKGATVVCLLPARTDTAWFHDYIYGKARIHFLRGRLKFAASLSLMGKTVRFDQGSAPFPSMVAIFEGKRKE